jgi:phosphatidylinositol alpha-mannosyltransferase
VKVGIVVPFSWSFWGGVPEHADHQARALHDLGHDARIIMGHDPPGRLTRMLHPREGRHERPPGYVIPVGRSVIVPANGSLSNIVLTPRSLRRISRVLERERFDVIHVHEPITPIIGTYALAAADGPIVSTSHTSGRRCGGTAWPRGPGGSSPSGSTTVSRFPRARARWLRASSANRSRCCRTAS